MARYCRNNDKRQMMNRMSRYTALFLIAIFSGLHGQSQTVKAPQQQLPATGALPPWAEAQHYDASAHAYFPDYYTYYDAARKGYVYWDQGAWKFTSKVPPYMQKADLKKSRIKILKDISLDLHPELHYPRYMKLYPADHKNNLVPVPIPGSPGN